MNNFRIGDKVRLKPMIVLFAEMFLNVPKGTYDKEFIIQGINGSKVNLSNGNRYNITDIMHISKKRTLVRRIL